MSEQGLRGYVLLLTVLVYKGSSIFLEGGYTTQQVTLEVWLDSHKVISYFDELNKQIYKQTDDQLLNK